MSNMSYCRFENTYHDLVDCRNNINETLDSETEIKYREKLVKVCHDIINSYDGEDNNEEDSEE